MNKLYAFNLLFFLIYVLNAQVKPQDSNLNLMPWPQQIQIQKGVFEVTNDFSIQINTKSTENLRIYKASTNFLRNLSNKTGLFIEQGFVTKSNKNENPSVLISIDAAVDLFIGIDESYQLIITNKKIEIIAKNDIGAMYGLNTLLQLLSVEKGHYVFPRVEINDSPRFAWRGLMIDVARHFMPIDVIKRNLDAMAYVKLNVFHWHLSDDQGFRIESKKLPLLTRMASDGLFYTQNQILDIVQYANDRGIRVVPEIDIPGHASALLTAYPELSSNKQRGGGIERFSGVFNPTLDPSNAKTYDFLDTLFAEITPLFPDLYFHIGGDENEGKDWNNNVHIQQFMKDNGLKNNHELQTYFNVKLQKILNKYHKILMGWDEIMTADLPKDAIIHSWRGEHEGLSQSTLIEAAKKGYKTVLSNGFYIDRMQSASHYYKTEFIGDEKLTDVEFKRILGGEATMWSELVTPLTIDSRIWPRTAAIAERFWSPKEIMDVDSMYKRLKKISENLEQIGIMHIRNKQVILRNISNYQDVSALNSLSNISEPFKIYSRNSGGKQYKTYSPFTLFADACNVDAQDAIDFKLLCKKFMINGDENGKNKLLKYLESWSTINTDLNIIAKNAPIVNKILPYSSRVSKIANFFVNGLINNGISKEKYQEIILLLEVKEDDKTNLDVELALKGILVELADYLKK